MLALLLPSPGCAPRQSTIGVSYSHSLAPLIQELARRFEGNHPGVRVQSEPLKNWSSARRMRDLGPTCDVIATDDWRQLSSVFSPAGPGRFYSFLGDEMVLATARRELLDTLAEETDWKENWSELLFRGGYLYGLLDPRREASGYQTHLVWKLAEIEFNRPGLYRRFLVRLDSSRVAADYSELEALLRNGALDFAFVYRSTAIQDDFQFVALPPQISLGEPSYAPVYAQAFVRVPEWGSSSSLEITGRPIRYGIAAPDPSNLWARRFVDFVVSPDFQQLYRELGYAGIPVKEWSPQE
ncbi:MAG: substrate-binding domain-containing protein [Acidobacteriota bacterium]